MKTFISSLLLTFNLVVIIFFPLSGFSQSPDQGIKGTVKDAVTLRSLESVNLFLTGTIYGTISRSDGSFVISGIPEGKYELQASMVGYQIERRTISVKAGAYNKIDIELNPDVMPIDSVVVFGRKKQNYIVNPSLEPLSLNAVTSKVNRDEIERLGSINLIDAMKFVPGAMIESRGRKVKQFFSVRGQKYPYPDYAINGIWQKEFHELPYFISASDIEEVEIVRSSAALITGLSGLTGVINIKTRTYEESETSAETEYGTFNTFHFHASHGGKYNNLSYAAGVGYDRTDGPEDKNAGENIANVYGRVDWQPLNKLDISANLYSLNGRRELALAELPATRRLREEISYYDQIRTTLTNVKAKYKVAGWTSLEAHAYYSSRKPIYSVVNMNDPSIITETREYDHEWGFNLIQALNISSYNTLRIGGMYNHWIAPEGKRFYVGRPCDLETISTVLTDEHVFGSVTVDAGIKWSRTYMNEYGAFDIGESGTQFTSVVPIIDEWQPGTWQGSLGLTWNLTGNSSLFCHSALGHIKPREGSLTGGFSEPLNETRLKTDLGFQTKWMKNGKLTITGFLVDQKNAISLSGQTYEQNGITLEFYQNRNEDRFGMEMDLLTPRFFNLFSAFANFVAMRSRVEENGSIINNEEFPEIISSAGLNLSKYGFDLNLFGKYVSSYESSRFVAQTPGSPVVYAPLGDYFTLDITSGYTFRSKIISRVYLKLQNLTDKRYSTVAGYPDFGRQINIGLKIII